MSNATGLASSGSAAVRLIERPSARLKRFIANAPSVEAGFTMTLRGLGNSAADRAAAHAVTQHSATLLFRNGIILG